MKSDTAVSVPESEGNFIQLQSTHLSAFLATCECKPFNVVRGPELTAFGNPIARWQFRVNGTLQDIVQRWAKPKKDSRDWEQLSDEEKDIVINFLTAFSDNLKHFLADAKRESV